jgi:hypothetical protein
MFFILVANYPKKSGLSMVKMKIFHFLAGHAWPNNTAKITCQIQTCKPICEWPGVAGATPGLTAEWSGSGWRIATQLSF